MKVRARFAAVAAVLATVGVTSLFVIAAGASPTAVFRSLVEGSLLSTAALGETLTRTTPILLTGLGAVVAFRAGVLNIGLDGQLLAGAAAAAAAGAFFPGPPSAIRAVTVAAAMTAGALATVPALWLFEKRNVPVVLSTILLNLVASAHVSWLVRGPLRDPLGDYPQSPPLPEAVRLPALMLGSRATGAVAVAFLLALAVGIVLSRTHAGLALRATGEAPTAARAAGLDDVAIRRRAFALSGALAGLAGGLEVLAVTGRLYDPFSAGTGYTGIAAALLGLLHSAGTLVASFFLAAIAVGSSAMQRDCGVPASLASVIPAVAVLAALAASTMRRRSP